MLRIERDEGTRDKSTRVEGIRGPRDRAMLCGITMATDHRPFDLSLSSDLNPPLRSFPSCLRAPLPLSTLRRPRSSFPTWSFDSPVFAGSAARYPSSEITIRRRMIGSTDDAAHGGEGSILLMVAPSGSRAVFPSASRRRRRDCSLASCRRRRARSPPLVHLKTASHRTNRRDESVDTASRGVPRRERRRRYFGSYTPGKKATRLKAIRTTKITRSRASLAPGLSAGATERGIRKEARRPRPRPVNARAAPSLAPLCACWQYRHRLLANPSLILLAHFSSFFFTKLLTNLILKINIYMYIFFVQNYAFNISYIPRFN